MNVQETERAAVWLKRQALAHFAAPAGLRATVTCCMLLLVHCAALQHSHSLRLGPRLMRELWPPVDQARSPSKPCLDRILRALPFLLMRTTFFPDMYARHGLITKSACLWLGNVFWFQLTAFEALAGNSGLGELKGQSGVGAGAAAAGEERCGAPAAPCHARGRCHPGGTHFSLSYN